jgi:hypothetical protein
LITRETTQLHVEQLRHRHETSTYQEQQYGFHRDDQPIGIGEHVDEHHDEGCRDSCQSNEKDCNEVELTEVSRQIGTGTKQLAVLELGHQKLLEEGVGNQKTLSDMQKHGQTELNGNLTVGLLLAPRVPRPII